MTEGPHEAPGRWRLLAPLVALAGGVLAGPAAGLQELLHGSFHVAFVAAPIIEEELKPLGVYALLAWRPAVLDSRLRAALLSGLGGVAFALVESTLYMRVYFPEHSQAALVYRYTVAVALHAVWSFIVGLGINRRLAASLWGGVPFMSDNWKFFVCRWRSTASTT